jgi:hypothetical protein
MVLDEFIQMFFSVAALQTEKREDTKSTTASRIKFWLETVLFPPANDQMPLAAGGLLKSVGTEAGIDEVLARGQNAGGSGIQLNSYLPDANDFTHSLLKLILPPPNPPQRARSDLRCSSPRRSCTPAC